MEQDATARNHQPLSGSGLVRRKLNDGREFQVVKIFYDPAQLQARLQQIGWPGSVRATGRFFYYGRVRKSSGTGG